jgi:hypothetical protein
MSNVTIFTAMFHPTSTETLLDFQHYLKIGGTRTFMPRGNSILSIRQCHCHDQFVVLGVIPPTWVLNDKTRGPSKQELSCTGPPPQGRLRDLKPP